MINVVGTYITVKLGTTFCIDTRSLSAHAGYVSALYIKGLANPSPDNMLRTNVNLHVDEEIKWSKKTFIVIARFGKILSEVNYIFSI